MLAGWQPALRVLAGWQPALRAGNSFSHTYFIFSYFSLALCNFQFFRTDFAAAVKNAQNYADHDENHSD